MAIIEKHKARDTVVTESAMLIDRDAGKEREVDVTEPIDTSMPWSSRTWSKAKCRTTVE